MKQLKVIIFGHKGQLGSTILRALRTSRTEDSELVCLDIEETSGKSPDSLGNEIRKLIVPDEPACIVFANGITNPLTKYDDLMYSNYTLPLELMNKTRDFQNLRYITFGTIQEHFPDLCKNNSYLKSKLDLGTKVAELNTLFLDGRAIHMRLHTLYGNNFSPHMFLGQILQSLKANQPFNMSHGQQLREYHHIDDITKSVLSIMSNKVLSYAPLEINHGCPIKICDLAIQIFRHFDKEPLLCIGEKPADPRENKDRVFDRSPKKLLPSFRDPIEGILECFRKNGL